ncbi:primosome assembly protein PriA [Clostridium acetobutylicum]|nr:primosome assembly protein PriA [Clostridium acetobutylicum]
MYNFAGIIINNEVASLDRIFTYEIPEELKGSIKVGQLVKVPFGNSNKRLYGFVFDLKLENKGKIKLKKIASIESDEPLITDKDMQLIENMKKKYLCTYIECIRLIIPTGIMKGMKPKTTDVVFLNGSLPDNLKKDKYENIYKIVEQNNGMYNRSQLSKKFNISVSSINTMIKYGALTISEKVLTRYDSRVYDVYGEKKLNDFQEDAVNTILYSNKRKFLIHGVTGSGKTEIYMHLVKKMIEDNKQSIILVPEISLTPQMIERFKGRFGLNVAVFHSKLSDGERYDEWIRVKNGEVKVAVGARSALFLPFDKLGLIVIDEEHEGSYKSESDPKYNAIEVAEMKSAIEDCILVLGSATPAVETYYKTLKEDYDLITLKNRADGALMPEVSVVDMREELRENNKSIFSRALYESILETLDRKEQIILFLNRRGYSTFVSCRKCGYVFKCKNCDVSMTYHNNKGYLICHYCGSTQRIPSVCPKCGSKYVKYFGAGTERIEREIKRLFPNARTVRMDRDTTVKKDSYERIYNGFKNKEYDILIGTQMIAKGLDFKDVTLVGVVAADLTLNLPDYRAGERTFQLLCQVSGRAGRGSKKGKVVIQTYSPESYAIRFSSTNDYRSFFKEEIKLRHDMDYPPFNKLLLLNFSSKNEQLLIKNIQIVGDFLKNKAKEYSNIYVLGPCPSPISKINEAYRWQIVLKGDITYEVACFIKKSIYELLKKVYNNIRVSLDINPLSLL